MPKEGQKKEVGQHSLKNVGEDHKKAVHSSLVSWRSRSKKGPEEVELREGEDVAVNPAGKCGPCWDFTLHG